MLLNILFIVVGNFLFLYIFWKKLKEDYASDLIFTTSFYILAGVILMYIISTKLTPDVWFWLGFLGLVAGFLFAMYRHKLRFMETLEATVVSILPGLSLIFLLNALKENSFHSLIYFIGIWFLMIVFFVLDKHYKRFSWYKSGRIGFSGLTILGVFFLSRAIVAIKFPFVISFFGKYEVILSSIVAFISFLGVYNLARQRT